MTSDIEHLVICLLWWRDCSTFLPLFELSLSFLNVYLEDMSLIKCVKFSPCLGTHFSILCDNVSVCTKHSCYLSCEISGLSPGKALTPSPCHYPSHPSPPPPSPESHFYLKEWLTNWLLRLAYVLRSQNYLKNTWDIFFKMNGANLSFADDTIRAHLPFKKDFGKLLSTIIIL